jgi:hypothetical protein
MELVLLSKTAIILIRKEIYITLFQESNKIETEKLIIETDLQTKIEDVINEIPTRQMKRIDYKSKHINEISNLQTSILKNLIG